MTIKDVVVLSLVQGVTEFLPISSSGHLVIFQKLLKLNNVPVLFDLVLHLGTTLAIIVVYFHLIVDILRDVGLFIASGSKRRDSIRQRGNVRLFGFIAVSTAVTGIIGILFSNSITGFFYHARLVTIFLIITGVMLYTTRFTPKGSRSSLDTKFIHSILIGIAQSFAMLPGISRSGSTISAGLYLGFQREYAGSYSFLLAIPSILGASAFEAARHSQQNGEISNIIYLIGFVLSFVSGYVALRLLINFLKKGRLYLFSFYCIAVGILGFIILG